MKKILISFLSLITCLSVAVSFVGSAAEDLSISQVVKDTTFQESMGNGQYTASASGLVAFALDQLLEDVRGYLNDPTNYVSRYNDLPYVTYTDAEGTKISSLRVPRIEHFSGKNQLEWYSGLGIRHTCNCQIDYYACTDYKYDVLEWVLGTDGNYYPINCLIHTITHQDGSKAYYAVKRASQRDPIVYHVDNYGRSDYIELHSARFDYDVYEIGSNQTLTRTNMFRAQREIRLYTQTTNSILQNLPALANLSPTIPVEYLSGFNPPEVGPSDEQIINNEISLRINDGNAYVYPSYFVSFIETNNPYLYNDLSTAWTEPSQKVYNYNEYFSYDNTINENNANNYYDGAFVPILNNIDNDIDWNQVSADLAAKIQPDIDLGLGGLLGDLLDLFGNMPDIGLPWGEGDDDNDYFQLFEPEPPDPPTTTVPNYTPWEPPEYDPLNTTPFIPATYPEFTVSTIPANIGQAMSETLNTGWQLADTIGIIAIAVPCALFVILWRFTGK